MQHLNRKHFAYLVLKILMLILCCSLVMSNGCEESSIISRYTGWTDEESLQIAWNAGENKLCSYPETPGITGKALCENIMMVSIVLGQSQ